MPSYSSSHSTKDLFSARENPPAHHLVAFSDGGARGNPGPSGYGVVIQDEAGRKVAALSEYLGHQTNNFAEYQGLIAALEYAVANGHKALKVISDSELLVRQIKGHLQSKECRAAGSPRSRKRTDRTARVVFHRTRPPWPQRRSRPPGQCRHGPRHGARGAGAVARVRVGKYSSGT
jgi:ribonuclease HI